MRAARLNLFFYWAIVILMVKQLWTNTAKELIGDGAGNLISCDDCPCCPCPGDNCTHCGGSGGCTPDKFTVNFTNVTLCTCWNDGNDIEITINLVDDVLGEYVLV